MALLGFLTQQAVAGGDTVEGKQAEAARLTSDLEDQAGRIIELDRKHRQAQSKLAAIEGSMRQAEDGVRSALARQEQARHRLRVQAIDAYMRGGNFSFIGKLTAGSEIVLYDTYRQVAAGSELDAIEGLRTAEEDLEARRRALELVSGKARAEADAIRSDRVHLEQAVTAQRARVAQVNGEVAALVAAEQNRRAAAAADARRLQTFSATNPVSPTAAAPASRPAPAAAAAPPVVRAVPGDPWACIRQLESGNNYSSAGGGAYQFQDATWQSLGYSGSAEDAPPEVQDQAARQLQARDGWKPWTTAAACGLV